MASAKWFAADVATFGDRQPVRATAGADAGRMAQRLGVATNVQAWRKTW